MKKIFQIVGVLIAAFIIVFGIYLSSLLFQPVEYHCGLSKFGGPVGASSPDVCEREWKRVELYKPVCVELVENHNATWESLCKVLLFKPLSVRSSQRHEVACDIIHVYGDDEKYCKEQMALLYKNLTNDMDVIEILELYKPLCEYLAPKIEPTWEKACGNVLQDPYRVCEAGIQSLGIILVEKERKDCIAKITDIKESL